MPSLEELSAELAKANTKIQELTLLVAQLRGQLAERDQKLIAVREGIRPVLEALE